MAKIYSYILRFDDGAAPNPLWGLCTLTICKPVIRRKAQVGDWVIGTGSKNTRLTARSVEDMSDYIVYAMKISDVKTLKEYDAFCKRSLTAKMPLWKNQDWKRKVGDCIYDYADGDDPKIRTGVHNEGNRQTDLNGQNALLSDHFYYFGSKARLLPPELREIIKKNQGHKKIVNPELIEKFECWIDQFEKNRLYAEPQMSWIFDRKISPKELSACSNQRLENDDDQEEETVC